ncbi:Nitrogen fixation protein of unknown function [Synechococcus sp. MIT S9509]|uniref:Nif11-like leader peptide family RiPP precursor n=1 Tax=Synechococcus sp. MIT S9509 TaxID=1801630 RepID=UPI0007BC53CC|nr:Nif11-like leader peptide family RiPP precursor [Synechococcus sp. MIT S9509]KZR92574.1 Nitrogen fixation protein of unknown function [Synechococcus sp. MIT S9509]
MTQKQLTAFLAHVNGNTILREQLKAAADVDAVTAIAEGAGLSIFSDDIENAQSEISSNELEGVAEGFSYTNFPGKFCKSFRVSKRICRKS